MRRHRLGVRERAQAKGLNLNKFSQRAELSPGTASNWWYGTLKQFDAEVMERICDLLECDIPDLFVVVQSAKRTHDGGENIA